MIMKPSQLRDLLAALLEGAAGKPADHWRKAIGEVEELKPIHSYVQGNWRVQPKGTKKDIAAIERAVDVVRAEHPYVLS